MNNIDTLAVQHDGHDIDRNLAESEAEATAIVGRYVDPAHLGPNMAVDSLAWAHRKAAAAGIQLDSTATERASKAFAGLLRDRATDRDTLTGTALENGRVFLSHQDTSGEKPWLSYEFPSIVFCALRDADRTVAELAGSVDGPAKAVAVYFDPGLAGPRTVVSREPLMNVVKQSTDGGLVMDRKVSQTLIGTVVNLSSTRSYKRQFQVIGVDENEQTVYVDWSQDGRNRDVIPTVGPVPVFGTYTRPNEYNEQGYFGIVEGFGTVDDALEARDELMSAVRTLSVQTTDTAIEEDAIRSIGVDEPSGSSVWDTL